MYLKSKFTILFQVQFLKSASAFIEKTKETPSIALETQVDAFGRPLLNSDIIVSLQMREEDRDAFYSLIHLIADATSKVMQRQLQKYLHGILSDPSPEMRAKAASAPLHNIWAERTLGILDAQLKRAPNATVGFLDPKTRVKMNHTIEWLEQKSLDFQKRVIKFAIRGGVKARALGKQRKEEREETMFERQREKEQQRDMTKRRKLGKDVARVVAEGRGVDDEVFRDVAGDQLEGLVDLFESLRGNGTVVGREIRHVWRVGTEDVIYNGRILRTYQGKNFKRIKIAYWTRQEEEGDAVDFNINLADFLADAILGDLQFC